MKLICISTGSTDGNSYLLQSKTGKMILLDFGVPYKSIVKASDYKPNDIMFGLWTHQHKDHFNQKTLKELKKHSIYVFNKPLDNRKYQIKDVAFTAFPVPHTNSDGTECPCRAFIVEMNGQKLLYMTDWMYCKYDLSKFNINHFLIAVNYTDLDVEDKSGKISHVVRGHSSLETVKEFLKTSMTDACKTVIACHLSSRNADESKIVRELTELVPETVNVVIAKKGMTLTL